MISGNFRSRNEDHVYHRSYLKQEVKRGWSRGSRRKGHRNVGVYIIHSSCHYLRVAVSRSQMRRLFISSSIEVLDWGCCDMEYAISHKYVI